MTASDRHRPARFLYGRGADCNHYAIRPFGRLIPNQGALADGDTTEDQTAPLVFENGVLIGWGQSVLASILR